MKLGFSRVVGVLPIRVRSLCFLGLLAACLGAIGLRDQGAQASEGTPQIKMDSTLTWETMKPEEKSPKRDDKLVLTDAEWRRRLTADQYRILRSHATDPAFCGILEDNHLSGVYHCAGCKLPLFKSDAKFDSGTGWPSFLMPVERKNVWFRTDKSYGMVRMEVLCARCDGHLGHVFPDGPKPTGIRFCINGNALNFMRGEAR